jgi:NAD-dependent SIR2 family protein deacetylase
MNKIIAELNELRAEAYSGLRLYFRCTKCGQMGTKVMPLTSKPTLPVCPECANAQTEVYFSDPMREPPVD